MMTSEKIRVRRGIFPEDISKIVALNVSDVAEWRHRGSDFEDLGPATWNELTKFERWVHGGPWLDPDLLRHYAQVTTAAGGEILIAETDEGDIVGELDYIKGPDPPHGIRGHLIWVITHLDWRRQGIGRKLVEEAKTRLEGMNIKSLRTWPEDERSEQFYICTGFQPIDLMLKLDLPDISHFPTKTRSSRIEIKPTESLPNYLLERYHQIIGTNNHPVYDLANAFGEKEQETLLKRNGKLSLTCWLVQESQWVGFAIIGSSLKIWIREDLTQKQELISEIAYLTVKEGLERNFLPSVFVDSSKEELFLNLGFRRTQQGTMFTLIW